jgi:hypothetical protein
MKHLRLFESFQSESEVAEICDEYGIENWSINSEGLVDVDSDVRLCYFELVRLPLKFGKVTGTFDCSHNKLITLEGCPSEVGSDFYCSVNKLTSLEGCPHTVGVMEQAIQRSLGNFYCRENQLTSLEGGPKNIGGNFGCEYNPLKNIWDLINPEDDSWDNQVMELFNDYDCIRGTDVIIDRLNDFLEEIGQPTVDKVKGYNI